MDKFTLFTGGAFLLSNHKDHQKNDLSITFGKASKCLTALLLLLFMGFSSFASSSTTLATENNTNSFSCNAKASDIWLVASNGREIQVSNGQQLCLVLLELEPVEMLEVLKSG